MNAHGSNNHISVTHINIRQSISILIIKIILIEVLLSNIFLVICISLSCYNLPLLFIADSFILTFFKLILTIYVVCQWLCEYYEIMPTAMIHRSGLFFQKEEDIAFKDVQSIKYEQSFFGKLLNFGSISLYDWKLKKRAYMYLIHNPKKYFDILKNFLPNVDVEKKEIREHIIQES